MNFLKKFFAKLDKCMKQKSKKPCCCDTGCETDKDKKEEKKDSCC